MNTNNSDTEEIINLIRKQSKEYFNQGYINLLSVLSSQLKTDKLEKSWPLNFGNPGVGKSRFTSGFIPKVFHRISIHNGFSPESLQDIICEKHKDNEVLVIPEIDEFLSDADNMLIVLKNLKDGYISKTLKKTGKDKKPITIKYFFNSIIISGINVYRKERKYEAIYDRYLILYWEGTPEGVKNARREQSDLLPSDYDKIRKYIQRIIEKVVTLKDLEPSEKEILNNKFDVFVDTFCITSKRPGKNFDTITKMHSLFMLEEMISNESAEFVLDILIENRLNLIEYTGNNASSNYSKVILALRKKLFSRNTPINKEALIKFIEKEAAGEWSESTIDTGIIPRLTKERVLEKVIIERRWYYQLKK